MLNLVAGVFTGFAAFLGGILGIHASSTAQLPERFASSTRPFIASTTADFEREHLIGSSTAKLIQNVPAVIGKVSAVDGTTLSVIGRAGKNEGTTTISVDASNAKVFKNATTTISVSDIQVGDNVMVAGKEEGDTITAKVIIVNFPARALVKKEGEQSVVNKITTDIRQFFGRREDTASSSDRGERSRVRPQERPQGRPSIQSPEDGQSQDSGSDQ